MIGGTAVPAVNRGAAAQLRVISCDFVDRLTWTKHESPQPLITYYKCHSSKQEQGPEKEFEARAPALRQGSYSPMPHLRRSKLHIDLIHDLTVVAIQNRPCGP